MLTLPARLIYGVVIINDPLHRLGDSARPPATPHLSVSYHVDARFLLHLQSGKDGFIFDLPQLFQGNATLFVGRPGLKNLRRP